MEILAENHFAVTKSLFWEGMQRVSAESYGKFAGKAVAFLGLAWLILAAATVRLRQSLGYVGIELIILCLAGLWITVLIPRYKANRAFHALEGSGLERATRFYPDRLEVETPERETVVPYSEIRQVLRAKRVLVLVTGDGLGILLKLDSFSRGSEAVVQELIQNAEHKEDKHD